VLASATPADASGWMTPSADAPRSAFESVPDSEAPVPVAAYIPALSQRETAFEARRYFTVNEYVDNAAIL